MAETQNDNRSSPPFQLRPNKFVDRMLFLDLISRNVGDRGAQDYMYISMGAKFLYDHHAVYRRTGIEELVSFDRNDQEIKRQEFNRPTNTMKCLTLDSANLAGDLDDMRTEKRVIIWLDFMSPRERRSQLQQTEDVLQRLQVGDLFRVTLNASYGTLGRYEKAEKTRYKSEQEWAAAELINQIEEYLPGDLELLTAQHLPAVLAGSIERAADRAKKFRSDVVFVPVLSTAYRDKQRMITVACAVRPSDEQNLPDSLGKWKFRSKGWDDILNITVPELSIREKQVIDRKLDSSTKDIFEGLPFAPQEKKAKKELERAINSYKKLHRYYPEFQHIEF